MTDREEFSEQFEAWWLTKFSKEFLDSDNCWSAWTGWQARGELDAVRIKELEDRLNDTKNYHIEWCGANVKIEELTAKLDKAKEALEFYADRKNWHKDSQQFGSFEVSDFNIIYNDFYEQNQATRYAGNIARQALELDK